MLLTADMKRVVGEQKLGFLATDHLLGGKRSVNGIGQAKHRNRPGSRHDRAFARRDDSAIDLLNTAVAAQVIETHHKIRQPEDLGFLKLRLRHLNFPPRDNYVDRTHLGQLKRHRQ